MVNNGSSVNNKASVGIQDEDEDEEEDNDEASSSVTFVLG